MAKTQSMWVTGLLGGWLACSACTADPLHQYGPTQVWRHENSGWKFLDEVGGFKRAATPYTIDGGPDVGINYAPVNAESNVTAVLEIFLADSPAIDATPEGARASAAKRASDSSLVSKETPFRLVTRPELQATKVTFASNAKSGPRSLLYFVTNDRFRVKVLVNRTGDPSGDKAVDDFVQALPWNTLGTDPNIF